MTELSREGRRLTRDGQHLEALARFEEALAIDRGGWRLSCEAAFVAWRAENVEAADRLLRSAMNGMPPGFVPEAQRVPTAMCLFNAGLIAEARGHADQARGMWQESIRLRPNDTVAARLAALPAETEAQPVWQTLPATASIAEIVAAMRADFAASGLAGFEAGELTAEDIVLEVESQGSAPGLEVHRIHGRFGVPAGEGAQIVEALVVRGAGAQRVALVGQAYDAGRSISSTDVGETIGFEDVLPGGQPELVVTALENGGSEDCMGSGSRLLVCSLDSGSLACFSVSLSEMSECVSMDIEDEEGEIEGYCRRPHFEGGSVSFDGCQEGAPDESFIDGTHALRALLDRGDIRWPDTWVPFEPVGS